MLYHVSVFCSSFIYPGILQVSRESVFNVQPVYNYVTSMQWYTDHAGPEIPVHLSIASPFSRQIAIDNAGPSLALESMGPKRSFGCHFLNIALIYKQ